MWICEPLNLRSHKKPCEPAIKNGTFACQGCSGAVYQEGEIDMSKKKPCVIQGCDSPLWKGDYCYRHHPSTIVAKAANPKSMENKAKPAVAEAVEPVQIESTPREKKAGHIKSHYIDLMYLVKRKLQSDMDNRMMQISSDLSDIETDEDKFKYVFEQVL